jgi:hypothetical protein
MNMIFSDDKHVFIPKSGTTTKNPPKTNQLFRMDYHPWIHTTDDYNFEIKGNNGNDFHFHLRDY